MCIGGKKGGFLGKVLDPAGAIGRKVGGTTGMLIDPAGAITDPQSFQKKRAQTVARNTAPKRSKPTLITSEESDSATLIG